MLDLGRDSPDESQTGINVRVSPALLQDRREVLTATSTSGNPNMSTGGGLLPVALQSGEQVFGFCNSLSALGDAIHVVGI
jgi:hypothetical protein